MTKVTLPTPSRPLSQPAPHQGDPIAGQDDDNPSVSHQRNRKMDRIFKLFRPSSPKPKATNSQSTSLKSSIKLFSTVRTPGSVDINHTVSNTAVKTPPFNVRPPMLPVESRLVVFPHNVNAPTVRITLPKFGARIESTAQLAFCISLLSKGGDIVNQQDNPSQDTPSDADAHLAWVKAISQDPIEQDRLLWLGTRMVDEFAKDAFKDSTKIAEIVLIGPVLNRGHYRGLLASMIIAFDQSFILDVDLLQGLVQLVQSAPAGSLVSDDFVKILSLVRVQLQGTHQQSSVHPYYLTLAVSRLLDVMADNKVQDLNRVEEHEPLSKVLSGLRGSLDPYLMYQACYAFQALQYMPDDETVLQAVLRHSTGVVDGLVKITAVMKLDLGAVLEGLCKLQEVLESTIAVAGSVYDGMCSLMESGRGVFDSLKEGYGSGQKRPWYAAIRVAYSLVQAGQFQDLNRLICVVPCRRDPLFQWGICQLLGEIAFDDIWDSAVRQQAVDFLGVLYKDDPEWGQDESVKTWMLNIIGQLGVVSDQAVCESSRALLKDLKQDQGRATSLPYPLMNQLALPTSSPILTRVYKIPPLEYDVHRIQVQRLGQSHQAVYIPPMAKSSLKAKDDDLFSLMEKTQEFLASERQVMLVLGDSGAGKSTFNRYLEHRLWTEYKQGDPIPLFINLPAIDRPDQDLIAKQLKFYSFSDDQILEIKLHRQLVLICDGYDESQQLVNLHRTNSLNQHGQWNTKMIISCRTQFLGPDYHSRFVPQGEGGHYDRPTPNFFQEAVIAPFSQAQIENFVEKYVPLEPRIWGTRDYMERLTTIPNLLDLVRNPFLLSLALEALPGVTEGRQDLSTIKITRVRLYDTFVNHWLDVNKRRLERNNALSMDDRDMLNQLVNAGFTSLGLDYATRLALAIFDRQDGNPVVKYVHFNDKKTWRAEFFGPQPEIRLLRESLPLTRTGNLFRFVHRSMLEYFLSRAIYNPVKSDDDSDQETDDEFIGSSSHSLISADCLLFRRNLLAEPSIIQFLCDRVKSNPDFEQQLHAAIDQSRTNANAAIAATNAATILVRAGVSFNGADLRDVKIPGADLSEGQFDSVQFQGADLTGANLSRAWLRQADLSGARLEGARFGELPYLEMDSRVTSCAYSPDGTMLVAGFQNDGLDVYNTTTWTRVHQVRDVGVVRSVAFSPDSQQIVFGGESCMLQVWDCSGENVLAMEEHTYGICSVAYSPCGMLLASACEDKTVRVWNSQTGKSLFVLEGHTFRVESIKFSPDGRRLVSGSWDKTIRFWDSETGEPGVVLKSLLGYVDCLAYSHDGRWVVSGHHYGALQLWDAVSKHAGPVLRGHTQQITGIAFSLNNQWIASCSWDETVRLWDSSTGVCVSTLTGHKALVHDVAFSPDGLQVASGGHDKRVRLWDISSIGWTAEVQEDQSSLVNRAMYSSKNLFLLSFGDRSVRQWDPVAGKPGPVVFDLPGSTNTSAMKVLPCDNQIAVRGVDNTVRLWDRRTGTVGCVLEGHRGVVFNIVYSPCGRWLFTRDMSRGSLLWDLHDTKQVSHFRVDIDAKGYSNVSCVAFSSSGHQLAICYSSYLVHIFGLPSRNLVKSKDMTREKPWRLAFSPDGQQLAIGCEEGSIYLWNNDQSDDEEFSAKLNGHQIRINSIAYSLCGQWIASGSEDRTVQLWHRLEDELESWSCVATVSSFFGIVYEVAWSPVTSMEFVTSCGDDSVQIWRVSSNGGRAVVSMQWSSSLRMLYVEGLVLKDATGLSPINHTLLVQRGAVDASLVHEGDRSET